jgi:hypothetical protein
MQDAAAHPRLCGLGIVQLIRLNETYPAFRVWLEYPIGDSRRASRR